MLNVVQWLLLRKNMCDKNNPIIQIAYVECQSEYVRTSLFSPPLVCYYLEFLLFVFFLFACLCRLHQHCSRVYCENIHNYETYIRNNSMLELYYKKQRKWELELFIVSKMVVQASTLTLADTHTHAVILFDLMIVVKLLKTILNVNT